MSGVNNEVLAKATTASDLQSPQPVLTWQDDIYLAETEVPYLRSLVWRPGLGRLPAQIKDGQVWAELVLYCALHFRQAEAVQQQLLAWWRQISTACRHITENRRRFGWGLLKLNQFTRIPTSAKALQCSSHIKSRATCTHQDSQQSACDTKDVPDAPPTQNTIPRGHSILLTDKSQSISLIQKCNVGVLIAARG